MRKTVYLCSTLEQTGPTSQLFNIISGLDSTRYEPVVITLSPEKENSLKFKFDNAKIRVICLDASSSLTIKKLSSLLLAYLIENEVKVVHSQGIRADFLMSKLSGKVEGLNWVATLRNIPYLDYPPQYGFIKGISMAFVHLMSLRKSNKMIVVSNSVKRPLQKFFRTPIDVIPNGIDTKFYSKSSISMEELLEIKSNLDLNEQDINLVYTGVLEERKNILPLLDVIEKLDDFKLILVGNGTLFPKILEHEAVINGKVLLVGAVKDIRPYVAISDAFILVSKAEGLPNSVLESLSLDCPAILSDIGPHKEINSIAKNCTHLVDMSDTDKLHSFLSSSYKEWRDSIRKGDCRKIAKRMFSSSVNSTSYQNIY